MVAPTKAQLVSGAHFLLSEINPDKGLELYTAAEVPAGEVAFAPETRTALHGLKHMLGEHADAVSPDFRLNGRAAELTGLTIGTLHRNGAAEQQLTSMLGLTQAVAPLNGNRAFAPDQVQKIIKTVNETLPAAARGAIR